MAISNQLNFALEGALGSPETRDELVAILNNEISGTSANVPGSLVRRDGSGGFAAGTVTASLTGAASLNVLKTGDTMTGTLNMSNHSIINVNTPSSPQDATNKSYVDTLNATQTANVSANTSAITALQVHDTTQDTNIATNTANIATNTTNIATNTTNITTNTSNIATNTSNIATNTSNIATNTTNIATNTTNIATNTANIATLQGVGLSSNMHTLLTTSTTIQAAATAAGLNATTYLAQTLATAPAADIRIFIKAAISAGFPEIKQQMINAYDAVHSRKEPKLAKNIERIVVNQTHVNQQFVDLQLAPMSGSSRVTLNGVELVEGGWIGAINNGTGITNGSDYQMNYGGKYPTIYRIYNEVSAKEKTTVQINNTGSFFDTSGAAGKYFTIDSGTPDAPHYFWFKATDAGSPATDPTPGGTGFEVDILLADSANSIASKLNTVVAAQSTLFTSSVSTNTVTITNVNIGAVSIATAATSGATVTRTVLGITSNLNNNYMAIAGAYTQPYGIQSGADFILWFNVDGLGDVNTAYTNSQAGFETQLSGMTPIQVNIVSGSTAFTVANAIITAIRQNVPTLFAVTEPAATLAAFSATGGTTITSTTVTMLNASDIAPGMPIAGTGITAGTLVASVSGNTVVLNAPATATNTGILLTFNYLPIKIYKDEYVLNTVDTHVVPVSTLVNTGGRGFNMSTCFQVIGANAFDATMTEPSGRIGFLGGNVPQSNNLPPKTLSTISSPGTTTNGSTRISSFNMPTRIASGLDQTIRIGQFVSGTGVAAGTTIGQNNTTNFGSTGLFSAKKVFGTRDYAVVDPNGSPTTMAAYQAYAAAQPSALSGTLATVTTTGDLTYNSQTINNITTTGIVAGMQVQGPYIPFGTTVPANATLSGTTTNGSPIILMNSVTGIVLGMFVSGTGIPANAFVTAISLGSITINTNTTATGLNSLTFTAFGTNTLVLSMPSVIATNNQLGQTGALNTATSQTLLFGSCTAVATQSQTCTMTTGSPYATIASTSPNLSHLMTVTAGTGFAVGATIMNVATTYTFTVTAANATVGAVYSNNNFSYVVGATISGGTSLSGSGNGTPSASGTLTKVSGTGDATITFSTQSAASTRITMSVNATVTASNSITFGPSAGMLVTGTGIPAGTFVTAKAGTTLSLSAIPTATGAQTLSFTAYFPTLTLGGILNGASPGLSADQKITTNTPIIVRVRTVSGGDIITQSTDICHDSLMYSFSLKNSMPNDLILSQPATATSTGILNFTILNPTSIEAIESLTPLKVGDILVATYDVDDNPIPTYNVEFNVPFGGPSWDGADGTIDTWYTQFAYNFTIPSSSVTSGAVYSHNGFQYTVDITISSGTTLHANGTGAPLTSGTLTKVSGTGPSTIVFSSTSQSTITMPYKVKGEGVPILCLGFTDSASDLDGIPNMAGQMPTGKCYFVSAYPGSYRPFGAAVGGFTDAQTQDIQAWNSNSPGNPFSDLKMSSTIRAICALVERFNTGPMFILANDKVPQVARMLCQARPDLFRGMFTTEPFDTDFLPVSYTGVGTAVTPWASVGTPLAGITSNGSNVISMGSGATNYTVGVYNGAPVSGPGIQAGTTVSSFTAISVTLSLPANASGANYFLFGGAPSGSQLQKDYFYDYCTSNDQSSSNPTLVTGNVTSGSNVITGLTSTKGIIKGMSLTGTGINVSDSPIGCTLTSGSNVISNISGTDIAKIKVGMQVWGSYIQAGGFTINPLTLLNVNPPVVLSVGASSVVVSFNATNSNTSAVFWFINVVRSVTPTTITMTANAFATNNGVSIRGRMIQRDSNFYQLITLDALKRKQMELGIIAGNIKVGRVDNLTTSQAYAGTGNPAWGQAGVVVAGPILPPTAYIQAATYQFDVGPCTQADDGTHPNMFIDTSTLSFEVRTQNLILSNNAFNFISGASVNAAFDNGAGVGVDQGSGIYRSSSLSQPFKFAGGNSVFSPNIQFVAKNYLSGGETVSRSVQKKVLIDGSDLPNLTATQMSNRCQGMVFYRYDGTSTWTFMTNPSLPFPASIAIDEANEWLLGPTAAFHAANPFNDTGTQTTAVGFGTYLLSQFVNSTDVGVPAGFQNWQQVRNIIKPQL